MTNVLKKLLGLEKEIEAFQKEIKTCNHEWTPSEDNDFLFDRCDLCSKECNHFKIMKDGEDD